MLQPIIKIGLQLNSLIQLVSVNFRFPTVSKEIKEKND